MTSAMKLEAILIPVSDVDRAKGFYTKLGWRLDADFSAGEFRILQFTPPGSGCSIQFGKGLTPSVPGSAQGLYLVVSDIAAARAELVALGVEASPVFHCEAGFACRFVEQGRVEGRGQSYGSFVTFADPDGNGWLLQEITTRLPGRVAGETGYASAGELAQALKRAAAAHGRHEEKIQHADPHWPEWYAEYLVREQSGESLPE